MTLTEVGRGQREVDDWPTQNRRRLALNGLAMAVCGEGSAWESATPHLYLACHDAAAGGVRGLTVASRCGLWAAPSCRGKPRDLPGRQRWPNGWPQRPMAREKLGKRQRSGEIPRRC